MWGWPWLPKGETGDVAGEGDSDGKGDDSVEGSKDGDEGECAAVLAEDDLLVGGVLVMSLMFTL